MIIRRVGKATGSRECAPDDKLRVPTIHVVINDEVGTAQMRLCPPYDFSSALIAAFEASARHCRRSSGPTMARFAFDSRINAIG